MMNNNNNSSTPPPATRDPISSNGGAVRPNLSSPPPLIVSHLAQTVNALDTAAEQLCVHRDFQAAFDTCQGGLDSLTLVGIEQEEDNRNGELKAGLCIIGIQALAELNQWQHALTWILKHYESPEKMPAKIMQLCIFLYTKVGDQAAMLESSRLWIHCPSNRTLAEFGSVAELYLAHVLVPLRHMEEAREFILGEVGNVAFTEVQRQTALDFLEEKEHQILEPPPSPSHVPETTELTTTPQGAVINKLKAMLRFLHAKLSTVGVKSFPLRKVFLAIVLLYMLFVRMDPALPSSFLWISKLLQLLKQMWNTVFAPYYQAVTQKKKL